MKKNRIPILVLSLSFLFGMSACNNKDDANISSEETSLESTEEETTNSSGKMTPGTYEASAKGMNDDITLEITVSEDKIEDAKVIKHSETPGIGGELKDMDDKVMEAGLIIPVIDVPKQIVDEQTIKVDNVTGATLTTAAIKAAAKDALTEAGANIEDFNKEIAHDEDIEDVESDVVIVGGGGAGLAAAITAAEEGKTVTIIEKNGSIGGDTLVCGAIYNNPDPELQKEVTMTDPVKEQLEEALKAEPINDEHKELIAEVQKQWDEYNKEGRTDLFDSDEWYALQTWNGGDNVANLDLVKEFANNAAPGYERIKGLGMKFNDKISQGAGSLWQRTHTSTMDMGTGFMSVYSKKLEDLSDKITVLTETTANNLVMDGDRVAGAKVTDNRSKKEYAVKAKDGLILATGGFAANGEMIEEYNTSGKWDDLSKTPTTNRTTSSQGDGIVMAKEIGASLTDMEQIQLLYLGNTQDGQLTKYPPRDVNGTDQIIFVNKEGKRFVREDGRRDDISKASLEQPESMFYMLESGDGEGYKDIEDPEWRSADGFTFDYLKENGYILVGDSLEEIAEQIGCSADDLKETVDKFNESVDSGKDEFGRTLYSTKLENGPWVATPRQACIHHTMGGVTIDTEARVLDEDGNPIPGLYAGGEITGGLHGANRLGGNAVVDTVVFGKLSAESLIKDSEK